MTLYDLFPYLLIVAAIVVAGAFVLVAFRMFFPPPKPQPEEKPKTGTDIRLSKGEAALVYFPNGDVHLYAPSQPDDRPVQFNTVILSAFATLLSDLEFVTEAKQDWGASFMNQKQFAGYFERYMEEEIKAKEVVSCE